MITRITYRHWFAFSFTPLEPGQQPAPDEKTAEQITDLLVNESEYLMNLQLLVTVLTEVKPSYTNVGDTITRYMGYGPEAIGVSIEGPNNRVYRIPGLEIYEQDDQTDTTQ